MNIIIIEQPIQPKSEADQKMIDHQRRLNHEENQELLSNGRILRNTEDLELRGHQQNLRKEEGNQNQKLSKWTEDQEAGRVSIIRGIMAGHKT